MLLSTLSFSFMNALVKYLVDYSAFQLVFFRSLGSLLITYSILKNKKINPFGNQRRLLVWRGMTGAISMLLFFWGVHYISVGSAVTLRYISPIFAALLAVVWLGEKVKPIQWLFFLVSFYGVYLIKSFDPSNSTFGMLLVLIAAFFSAIVYILIAKIGHRDHPVVVVHYFMIIATILGGIGTIFYWKTPDFNDLLLLSSMGFFGFFGQLFMTKAFQNGEAHMIAPFKYVEVIFTLLFGVFILFEEYQTFQIVGTVLVILGLILNVLFKAHVDKKQKNHQKVAS